MIIAKKSVSEWTHIILDEVHEREEDMDFLLLLCKKLLPEASLTTKLILMSATIHVSDFRDYFTYWRGRGRENVYIIVNSLS